MLQGCQASKSSHLAHASCSHAASRKAANGRNTSCSLAHASPPCSPWLKLGEEVKEALLQGCHASKSSHLAHAMILCELCSNVRTVCASSHIELRRGVEASSHIEPHRGVEYPICLYANGGCGHCFIASRCRGVSRLASSASVEASRPGLRYRSGPRPRAGGKAVSNLGASLSRPSLGDQRHYLRV